MRNIVKHPPGKRGYFNAAEFTKTRIAKIFGVNRMTVDAFVRNRIQPGLGEAGSEAENRVC